MKKALVYFGLAALILSACGEKSVEKSEVKEATKESELQKEPIIVDEPKEEEATTEVKTEEKPAEVNFDKAPFIAALTKDMDDNFGDAGGTEEPMEWFKYITKYDVDYTTKTVYAYTNIDTFNDNVTYDITNAMMNLINYDDKTYFQVEKFIVINAKGKEISTMNNRKN